jgi:chloride channel protein, CIC family
MTDDHDRRPPLLERLASRFEAMGRLGRRTAPNAPVWGWTTLWFQRSFVPSQNYLILLSVVVGLLTGLGSVGFIRMLGAITRFSREGIGGGSLGFLGSASLVLLPALGGLMAGPLIERFAKEAKGHGVPEVMMALSTRGGRIRKRVAMIKILASSLTIGFGGAAGREGPMVQIGATLGSAIGQSARLASRSVRTLVACGAAGGIAATFNAPIAGAIFAIEVLVGRIHTEFLPVLLTSVSSCIVARSFLGDHPSFVVPAYQLAGPWELVPYFAMGLALGFAAVGYVKLLYAVEDVFDKWTFPPSLKPAVGGLMVGIVLRFFPQVFGTGFPAIESALWVRFPWELLLALFAAEMVANCATLGSGGSGGVFAPGLYMGCMLGGAFGALVHAIAPEATGGPGAYAMVGMAAFFAAEAKAPMTALLILFEMTNDYRIMLPLMAATVGAVSVSHRLLPQSIYTLKLYRRGIAFPFLDKPDAPPPRPTPAGEGAPV